MESFYFTHIHPKQKHLDTGDGTKDVRAWALIQSLVGHVALESLKYFNSNRHRLSSCLSYGDKFSGEINIVKKD